MGHLASPSTSNADLAAYRPQRLHPVRAPNTGQAREVQLLKCAGAKQTLDEALGDDPLGVALTDHMNPVREQPGTDQHALDVRRG